MKRKISFLILICVFFGSENLFAQLKGHNLLGDFGLNSGTPGAPGVNIIAPVYLYTADKIINNEGNEIAQGPALTSFLTGIGVTYVTKLKILGANLGGTVLLPFIKNRIDGDSLNVKTPFAFTDIYVQPVNLGWQTKHADFVFSYGLTIPTGKYENGGDENSGLGMLSNEFAGGGTFYFNKARTWNFSSVVFYEIHSKKKDSETKVGDILTLEGGLTKTFYYRINKEINIPIANAGIAYYMQFKVSEDNLQIANNTYSLSRFKDRIFGVGPEANILFPKLKLFVDAKYIFEFGAKTRLQGGTLVLNLAYIAAMF